MITSLKISNLGIFDDADLALGPGLNVITGETGAGKSIIVAATELLRGGRAQADAIRDGSKEAVVEAILEIDSTARGHMLDQLGISLNDGELLIRRVLSQTGRGRVWINGCLSTAALLTKAMRGMIEISGQHEQQLLREPKARLAVVDSMLRSDRRREELRALHAEIQEVSRMIEARHHDQRGRVEAAEYLKHQLEELDQAGIASSESSALEKERSLLRVAVEIKRSASLLGEELYDSDISLVARMAAARRRLAELARLDPDLEEQVSSLAEAEAIVEDVAFSIRRRADRLEDDPERLETVEQRLDLISSLARKHGVKKEELGEVDNKLRLRLAALLEIESRSSGLVEQLDALRERAAQLAAGLSRAREEAGRHLGAEIAKGLGELGMKNAKFRVELSSIPPTSADPKALIFELEDLPRRLSKRGWDRVQFYFAANPGEDLRKLERVASGGELSRIMLALRQALGKGPGGTDVFDEVDSGVGGATADRVGRALGEVAHGRQVLVATHAPQVAAHASRHFRVAKKEIWGKTVATVELLDDQGVESEIARMLAGRKITDAARKNAQGLLAAAATYARQRERAG